MGTNAADRLTQHGFHTDYPGSSYLYDSQNLLNQLPLPLLRQYYRDYHRLRSGCRLWANTTARQLLEWQPDLRKRQNVHWINRFVFGSDRELMKYYERLLLTGGLNHTPWIPFRLHPDKQHQTLDMFGTGTRIVKQLDSYPYETLWLMFPAHELGQSPESHTFTNEDAGLRELRTRYLQLTNRQKEICRLIFKGYSGKQIAQQLYISPATVKTHRHNMLEKLGVHTVFSLAVLAATILDESGKGSPDG
jgi:DNA-binding CsgD family transcriptional regulator